MQEESESTETASSHEWTNFIVLVVILLGTIVVVALTRPFIFNRVIPAVMGEGQSSPPPVSAEEVEEVDAYPAEEVLPNVPLMEDTVAAESYPVEESEAVVEEEVLPTAVATISHTVQPGDNLINIARRYGVTVEAITAANKISNPNHIKVGTTLLIPQP